MTSDKPTLQVPVADLAKALDMVSFVQGSLNRFSEDNDVGYEIETLRGATAILRRCLGCEEKSP